MAENPEQVEPTEKPEPEVDFEVEVEAWPESKQKAPFEFGVIARVSDGVVQFLGYGTIDRQVPPASSAVPGSMCERYALAGTTALCYVLENGDVVFDVEAGRVGLREEIAAYLAKADSVKQVKIADVRAKLIAASKAKGRRKPLGVAIEDGNDQDQELVDEEAKSVEAARAADQKREKREAEFVRKRTVADADLERETAKTIPAESDAASSLSTADSVTESAIRSERPE